VYWKKCRPAEYWLSIAMRSNLLPGESAKTYKAVVAQALDWRMTRKRQTLPVMDRKQPSNKDRSNDADRSGTNRRAQEGRSGEGSESALATLKSIERDRKRSKPADDSWNK
jgi:hypothetical protein